MSRSCRAWRPVPIGLPSAGRSLASRGRRRRALQSSLPCRPTSAPALRRLAIGQFQSGEGDGHELGGVFRRAGGPLLPQFLQPARDGPAGHAQPLADRPAGMARQRQSGDLGQQGRFGRPRRRSPQPLFRGQGPGGARGGGPAPRAVRGHSRVGFSVTVDMAVSWENGLSTRSYNQLSISLNSCQEASRGFFRDSGCTARSDRRKCVRCHTLLRRNATENFRREPGKCRCAAGAASATDREQRAAISCAAST